MKIHLINLFKYKNHIYDFLFYRDNLVYFYILLYNISLLVMLSTFNIVDNCLFVVSVFFATLEDLYSISFKVIETSVVFKFILSHIIGPFHYFVLVILDKYFFLIIRDSLIFPVFTLVTLVVTYFQKNRIINTNYYKLFKIKLTNLFENNFTKYFLLFFVVFALYLFIWLSITFLVSFLFLYQFFENLQNWSAFILQVGIWFLPFLYSYFFLSFCVFVYSLFDYSFNFFFHCVLMLVCVIGFLAILLYVPAMFFYWGAIFVYNTIYHSDGTYNWYVIYKLSRYFIIYPIVTSFFTGSLLSLFLYFIKRK
jgi:hypothetical protein